LGHLVNSWPNTAAVRMGTTCAELSW